MSETLSLPQWCSYSDVFVEEAVVASSTPYLDDDKID